ncbi:hypothetical protein GW17_00025286 [Ensete ventricosum]|uniref:Uncharacterized protein n=1 Tax=Ensete ventricosum TaxID=4639 RepID=A0A444EL33_ENSVE|nr:hypothetical protein GW17_00025286 [Ensete ventricosum]RZR73782.1 hypothetical protein BHM03_00028090 [Ensete ventricosum]
MLTLQPLLRIFEPILKNASKELLHGSHTRAVSISTPSNGGIMKFAKKQLSCLGCKAVIGLDICIQKGMTLNLLFKFCFCWLHASVHALFVRCSDCCEMFTVSELEMLFGRLWTQCQECQGSLHQDVLCTRCTHVIFLPLAALFNIQISSKLNDDVSFVTVVIAPSFTEGRKHKRIWPKLRCNLIGGIFEPTESWLMVNSVCLV